MNKWLAAAFIGATIATFIAVSFGVYFDLPWYMTLSVYMLAMTIIRAGLDISYIRLALQ